jgi:hypothetical protein
MRLAGSALVVLVLATFGSSTAARADAPPTKKQTAQEKKRQQLLDELGLERVEAPPPPPAPKLPAPSADDEREAAAPKPSAGERPAPGPAGPAAPPAPSFKRAVLPLLAQACQPCHRTGGPAGMTRLLLAGEPAADYASVRAFVSPATPLSSVLLAKASGQAHAGGAPWPVGGDAHARVLAWIAKGARLDGPAAPAVAAPANGPATPPAARRVAATPPITPVPSVPATPETDGTQVGATASAAPSRPDSDVVAPSAPTATATDVGPLLTSACGACHGPRGPAAATRFVLTGDPVADGAAARAMLDAAAPARSPLVTKAQGELHGGGVVLPPGDPRLATLLAWVNEASKPTAPVPAGPAAPPPAPAVARPAPVSAAPSPHGPHGPPAGLILPGGFMLNGRFDLVYERRTFSGNPFADFSTAALRSYHHFLFLSRESASDPFGLSLEMLSLQFWEAHVRLGGGARAWRLVIGAGKIVVPFGADPLTHQSYGGLVGFDQRILPILWTQEGAAAHLTVGRGRLLITDDLFAVRGYALARADAVLNLQGDFSPADEARIGVGNRLGVSWLGASAWYSAYFNPLGFGRRLFMQALDVTLWRPRSVPVLGHFSAAAGLLRADVSGGGEGLDYYHLGSYFQLRYHPTDWLYVQYRQGLRTFDNRRGVIVDETRLTPEDASTHNFAVVARYRGVSVGLAYFLMLEKAGELPNDLLRASVTYEF